MAPTAAATSAIPAADRSDYGAGVSGAPLLDPAYSYLSASAGYTLDACRAGM